MEPIISTPVIYIAWFLTIGLGFFLWILAPHQPSEMGEFWTYLASVITAVFFVFLLTPLAIESGLTVLFLATYGTFAATALISSFYMLAVDKRDDRLLRERIEDDFYS